VSDRSSPQQTSDLRREIEALKAQAEAGMGENARGVNALAREKLLQMHRARFAANRHLDIENTAPMSMDRRGFAAPIAWTAVDLDALDWICRVAGAGHVGAHRLLERTLDGGQLPDERVDAKLWIQLAKNYPPVARFVARQVGDNKSLDLATLTYWLDLGGLEAASIAAGIREIYIDSLPGYQELQILRRFVESAGRIPRPWSETELQARRAELLVEIAERRLSTKSAPDEAGAERLLARASELGSRRAAGSLWWARYKAAPDREAFLREWLAGSPSRAAQGESVCLFVGAELELGNIGEAPDLEAALSWYASALGLESVRNSETGALEPAACLALGRACDFREHIDRLINRPALALGWYERGLNLGSAPCLGAWLTGCESGSMGLAPDPAAALGRVNRWLAAGGDAQSQDRQIATARDQIRKRGESNVQIPKAAPSADPAVGAKWLQVCALLGDAESQYLLAGLYARGHGIERDPQAAREWMQKAAASGSGRAVTALAKAERSARAPAKVDGELETTPLESEAANTLSGVEETDGLLDLAEVYLNMGDFNFAREMLEEVVLRGNEAQQERANKLFAAIAKK
jgi:FimV-like protein